jgi:hypothetical protein
LKIKGLGVSRAGVAMVAAALMSGCVTTEMIEQDTTLRMCDGYGLATATEDGISKLVIQPYMDTNRVRKVPQLQTVGVACDKALALLDSTYPQHWMRKVSVLQARAVFRLSTQDWKGALSDLDAADAAAVGHADPYFDRSLALNTMFIRAFALSKDGRAVEGDKLALQAMDKRPYSKTVSLAALTVLSPESSTAAIDDLLTRNARINPRLSDLRFKHMFETDRWQDALAAYENLMPPDISGAQQTSDLRANMYRSESQRMRNAEFWAEMDGRKAFALAALRRTEDASAALAAAEKRLAGAKVVVAALPASPTTEQRTRAAVQEQVNREIDGEPVKMMAFWTAMTRARLAANGGDAKGAAAILKEVKLASPSFAYFELAVKEDGTPYDMKDLKNTQAMRILSVGLPPNSPVLLFNFLMDAETKDRVTASVDSFSGLFMSKEQRERGDCREEVKPDGTERFCFHGVNSSLAIAEEQALLRVADKGAERGAGSFLIEDRDDIRHTTIMTTQYGTPISELDQGFESSLSVRFFVEEAGTSCWRCISVKDVRQQLSPFYRAPAKAAGAKK